MIIWHRASDDVQNGSEKSYVGGLPMLPRELELPIFEKTKKAMTFFFQIEMPEDHQWAGHIISVFSATDYVDDDSFIPKLPDPLAGANLTSEFFQDYEEFFRIFVFPSNVAAKRDEYQKKIAFRRLSFSDSMPIGMIRFGQISQTPEWILDDETPRSFNGEASAITFLFQSDVDYEFDKLNIAPSQKVMDYSGSGGLIDSDSDKYVLFTSNELYFFGVATPERRVYVVPQSS